MQFCAKNAANFVVFHYISIEKIVFQKNWPFIFVQIWILMILAFWILNIGSVEQKLWKSTFLHSPRSLIPIPTSCVKCFVIEYSIRGYEKIEKISIMLSKRWQYKVYNMQNFRKYYPRVNSSKIFFPKYVPDNQFFFNRECCWTFSLRPKNVYLKGKKRKRYGCV